MRALRLLIGVALAVPLSAGASSGRTVVPAEAVAAGLGHTCAITSAGGVKCWGSNGHDELGNGQDGDSRTPVDVVGLQRRDGDRGRHPPQLRTHERWRRQVLGLRPRAARRRNVGERRTPVDVSGLTSGVTAVAAGNDDSCALTSAGGVKCWGSNFRGQLGDGTTADRLVPTDVVGLTGGVKAIAAGSLFSCALTAAGGVECWGSGRLMPVDVPGLGSGVTAITPSCALTSGSGVKCWGRDLVPADVRGLSSGVTALASSWHSCALLSTGVVKCWGLNDHGQLGDGTTTDRVTPVDVVGLHGRATAISAGGFQSCALLSTGAVDCWGAVSGQLGGDSQSIVLRPVAVAGFGTAKARLSIVSRSVVVTRAHYASGRGALRRSGALSRDGHAQRRTDDAGTSRVRDRHGRRRGDPREVDAASVPHGDAREAADDARRGHGRRHCDPDDRASRAVAPARPARQVPRSRRRARGSRRACGRRFVRAATRGRTA